MFKMHVANSAIPTVDYKHVHASYNQGWRNVHFIEYYYVGIGGYCGMNQPIEQV